MRTLLRQLSILLAIFCASVSAASAQYFEVVATGNHYPWFISHEARTKYIDKHLPGLPAAIRLKALQNFNDPAFAPSKGDVGELVAEINPAADDDSNKVILSIEGNLVLIGRSNVRAVDRAALDRFHGRIKGYGADLFGFALGRTSVGDAMDVLGKAKAKHGTPVVDNDLHEIRTIRIESYSLLPEISGRTPAVAYLSFFRDRLYEIGLIWLQAKDPIVDVDGDITYLHSKLIYGLSEKYRREFRDDNAPSGAYLYSFWINNLRHCVLYGKFDNKDREDLVYRDTALMAEVSNRMKASETVKQMQRQDRYDHELKTNAEQL